MNYFLESLKKYEKLAGNNVPPIKTLVYPKQKSA